jgi:hypothetical protein
VGNADVEAVVGSGEQRRGYWHLAFNFRARICSETKLFILVFLR